MQQHQQFDEVTFNLDQKKDDTVQIKDIFRILSDRRYLKVVPMILVSAICVTGNSGILVPLMSQTMANTDKDANWEE
jgi:hypothetical protein